MQVGSPQEFKIFVRYHILWWKMGSQTNPMRMLDAVPNAWVSSSPKLHVVCTINMSSVSAELRRVCIHDALRLQ